MVSFIADAAAPDAPRPAPSWLNFREAEGATALFDEACPLRPIAARAADAHRAASGSKRQ